MNDVVTVYLALGSNVGNPKQNIATAVALLGANVSDLVISPLYVSRAVGYTNQADFVNGAVQGKTGLSPDELIQFIKNVEAKVGRIKRFQWGPREIDIDILFYGNEVIEDDTLTVPHPRFRERDFVLQPLVDLNPTLTDPVTGKTVTALLAEIPKQELSILEKTS